jgi:tetratricopeptide (TPR) repeat protein
LYHFLVPSPTTAPAAAIEPPPMPTQMQAKNIEYEAFEDARRNVDRNPELFIGAGGSNPQSAEDFYLLGRAYFLTGRYAEAKDAWTKAKTRISEVKTVNRKTLENEIALGLSTVENNIARTEFINQRRSFSSAAPTDANQAPSGGMNADGSQ